MKAKPPHSVLQQWLRSGRPEPKGATVEEHLANCASCRVALEQIEQIRRLFPDDEGVLDQEAASAIRFRLQAEARRQAEGPAGRTVACPRRFGRRLLAVAAVLLLVVGTGVFIAQRLTPSPVGSPLGDSQQQAQIEPAPGTRYERLVSAKGPLFRIHDGSVLFTVPPLAGGQQLKVVVGLDLVVVRGTRFRVYAANDRLEKVEVERGVVAVVIAGEAEIVLKAGASWTRTGAQAGERPDHAAELVGPPSPRLAVEASSSRRPPADAHIADAHIGYASVNRATRARREAAPAAEEAARTRFDEAFREGWRLIRAGRMDAASYALDALLAESATLAGQRRADALFWSAYAHERAGRRTIAVQRLEELLARYPQSWHAGTARRRLTSLRKGLAR
jgi:hypothetical protein